jgi:hypothetical protein
MILIEVSAIFTLWRDHGHGKFRHRRIGLAATSRSNRSRWSIRSRATPITLKAHAEVGKEVREAIRRMGNTMPEDLPPELPIKEIEKRLKPKKIAPPRGYLLVHRLSAALRAVPADLAKVLWPILKNPPCPACQR